MESMYRFKFIRKWLGGVWYKHVFTPHALQISYLFTGSYWDRYGKINKYTDVIKQENYE